MQMPSYKDMFGRNLMSKLTCQACLVLFIVVLSQINVDAGHVHRRQAEEVTASVENSNNTKNMTKPDDGGSGSGNAGAIVAASFIAVGLCIAVVVIVYIVRRKRQSRMMDKEKKMQIQMSSARNAGVYQDLTVSVPADEKPPSSPEHERLKSSEDA